MAPCLRAPSPVGDLERRLETALWSAELYRSLFATVVQPPGAARESDAGTLPTPGISLADPKVREVIAGWMRRNRHHRCREERQALAAVLGVTERTLGNWAKLPPDGQGGVVRPKKRGRKPASPEVRWQTYLAVQQVLRTRKRLPSAREVNHALKPLRQQGQKLPRSLVRDFVARIVKGRRKADQLAEEARRVRMEVLAANAIWAADATHLAGNPHQGTAVMAESVIDVASAKILNLTAGRPPRGEDVVLALKRAQKEQGTLPLVLMIDRGGENLAAVLVAFLITHHIVPLYNRPHTPKHNPHVERSHRTVHEANSDTGWRLPAQGDQAGWAARLEPVKDDLNDRRLMESRGWLCPSDFHARLPAWYDRVDRGTFYAAARAAVARAVEGIEDVHARRMAEREAIFETLERFLLIRRTRGRARLHRPKSENN